MSGVTGNLPSMRRSVFIAAAFAVIAVFIYMFAIIPVQDSIGKCREERQGLKDLQASTERDLNESPKVKSWIAKVEKERQPYVGGLLEPLLESWAMRAKSVLDPLAAAVGVKIQDYRELSPRALPLTKPVALQLYARRPVRIECRGSYAELASFLLRVERELPLVSVQALSIRTQQNPEEQAATIVFEWPAKGNLSRVPVKGGGK